MARPPSLRRRAALASVIALAVAGAAGATVGCPPIAPMALDGAPVVGALPSEAEIQAGAPPHAPDDVVRLVLLGDMGKAGPLHEAVAGGVRAVCATEDPEAGPGCDALVLLGDNLYQSGIEEGSEAEDTARLDALVGAYGDETLLVVLGNHDWGPARPDLGAARRQLAWAEARPRTFGATHFWRGQLGPVALWGLDSNYLVRGEDGVCEAEDLTRWLAPLAQPRADSEPPWRLVAVHHPLLSNGAHRNAGGFVDVGLALWDGEGYRALMAEHVVGQVDLIAAGHEHNMQFYPALTPQGPGRATAQLVTGSASKCSPRDEDPANPSESGVAPAFERYAPGFTTVIAGPDRLELRVHDPDGTVRWRARRTRDQAEWEFPDGESVDPTDRCAWPPGG